MEKDDASGGTVGGIRKPMGKGSRLEVGGSSSSEDDDDEVSSSNVSSHSD